jgi:voltage-dependent potassium channel beta subunit
MQYRRLGDAGVKLSEIGLGGWLTFSQGIDDSTAAVVMNKAFEVGINFLDTANVYNQGRCEEVWGKLLQPRRRSDYVLATKVFFPMGNGPNDKGLSRKHIFEQCHASLGRLRTDYIDLYQCHRMDGETPMEETVRAMDDLIRQGKILYWGFSEWSAEAIEQCLRVCGDTYYKPKSSQPGYNALRRDAEGQVFGLCAKAGIGQVAFSPIAQGVLTGKYKPGQAPPADSRLADEKQNIFIKRLTDQEVVLAKVQRLVPLAREAGCTMSQLALAWVLRRAEVTSAIIGASRAEQVVENAGASGLQIRPEILKRMEEILA